MKAIFTGLCVYVDKEIELYKIYIDFMEFNEDKGMMECRRYSRLALEDETLAIREMILEFDKLPETKLPGQFVNHRSLIIPNPADDVVVVVKKPEVAKVGGCSYSYTGDFE